MVKTAISPVGYGELKTRKSSGAHYTPVELADFVAKHVLDNLELGSKMQRVVLDPAVGDGELLAALARQAQETLLYRGYDIDLGAIHQANKLLSDAFSNQQFELEQTNFLEDINTSAQENLFSTGTQAGQSVDIVIANPPYIRTQVLGAEESKRLAKTYGLTGRVDIYHAFIAKIAEVLKPGGIAGIIVSNRFMYTQGGKSIRELILREFDVLHIWDFGDTKLFEAAVLPAVLILKKKTTKVEQAATKFTSIYANNLVDASTQDSKRVFEVLAQNDVVSTENSPFVISTGILHIDDGQPWRISEQSRDDWLAKVASNTFCKFEDISKVKVGVKTTADKVFIKNDWTEDNPELLIPLTTHHIARRFKALPPTREILYPYDMQSDKKKVVSLDDFKQAKKYLEKHRTQLEGRTYVIESGRQWYEIWVPHNPAQWKFPKVVFRDISEKPTFWVDFDGTIVNGDCYWMALDKCEEKYIWLILAVANSSFIEKFYDYMFNNKLYSGRRRFISQYVSKFPLPDPDSVLAKKIIKLTQSLYENYDKNSEKAASQEYEIDALIWQVFEVS